MSIHQQDTQALVDKIQSLPAERIAEVEDFVDFLQQRVTRLPLTAPDQHETLDFPVDDLGQWPEGLSLRRGRHVWRRWPLRRPTVRCLSTPTSWFTPMCKPPFHTMHHFQTCHPT
jgi:Protein of unknown function (DUF2281)